jgi:flagellum-specific ATP synthase
MPRCNTAEENALVEAARRNLAAYDGMAELIRLGAYHPGSDPELDTAIRLQPKLSAFLAQKPDEHAPLASAYEDLAAIVGDGS